MNRQTEQNSFNNEHTDGSSINQMVNNGSVTNIHLSVEQALSNSSLDEKSIKKILRECKIKEIDGKYYACVSDGSLSSYNFELAIEREKNRKLKNKLNNHWKFIEMLTKDIIENENIGSKQKGHYVETLNSYKDSMMSKNKGTVTRKDVSEDTFNNLYTNHTDFLINESE